MQRSSTRMPLFVTTSSLSKSPAECVQRRRSSLTTSDASDQSASYEVANGSADGQRGGRHVRADTDSRAAPVMSKSCDGQSKAGKDIGDATAAGASSGGSKTITGGYVQPAHPRQAGDQTASPSTCLPFAFQTPQMLPPKPDANGQALGLPMLCGPVARHHNGAQAGPSAAARFANPQYSSSVTYVQAMVPTTVIHNGVRRSVLMPVKIPSWSSCAAPQGQRHQLVQVLHPSGKSFVMALPGGHAQMAHVRCDSAQQRLAVSAQQAAATPTPLSGRVRKHPRDAGQVGQHKFPAFATGLHNRPLPRLRSSPSYADTPADSEFNPLDVLAAVALSTC